MHPLANCDQAFACACFCCSLATNDAGHHDQLLPLFVSLLDPMPVVAIRALLDIRTSTRVPKSTRNMIDSSGLQEKAMQVLPPLDTPTKQKAVSQLCATKLHQRPTVRLAHILAHHAATAGGE